jgi:hypothetical protein
VVALVGDRIYPSVLPQPPTFPAIAYTRVYQDEQFTDDGPSGLRAVRVQIDCYAVSTETTPGADGVRDLADAVRDALNGWRDLGVGVQKSQLVPAAEVDEHEPEVGSEGEGESYRVRMDFLVEGAEGV